MSFEDIPEDRELSYLCENCNKGEITKDIDGIWKCSECDAEFITVVNHILGEEKPNDF